MTTLSLVIILSFLPLAIAQTCKCNDGTFLINGKRALKATGGAGGMGFPPPSTLSPGSGYPPEASCPPPPPPPDPEELICDRYMNMLEKQGLLHEDGASPPPVDHSASQAPIAGQSSHPTQPGGTAAPPQPTQAPSGGGGGNGVPSPGGYTQQPPVATPGHTPPY